MNVLWRTIVWQQFGAAIDDLDNALRACPDELWRARLWDNSSAPEFFLPEYWYIVYHALFWLDLYLTGAEEGFVPPPPFALIEQDEHGPIPERPYTKDELQAYLGDCRRRCQAKIASLTDEAAQRRCGFGWGEVSFAELLLYNMRHVQGHAAQLNLLLGQKTASAPDWVTGVQGSAVQDKPESGFLSLLSAPARGALEHAGISTLTKLSQHSEREILKLHGVGPKTLPILRQALQDAGMTFTK